MRGMLQVVEDLFWFDHEGAITKKREEGDVVKAAMWQQVFDNALGLNKGTEICSHQTYTHGHHSDYLTCAPVDDATKMQRGPRMRLVSTVSTTCTTVGRDTWTSVIDCLTLLRVLAVTPCSMPQTCTKHTQVGLFMSYGKCLKCLVYFRKLWMFTIHYESN